MSDTQVLLGKIAALRQRLEQAQGLVQEAGSAAATLVEEQGDEIGRAWRLDRRLAAGAAEGALLDASIRRLAEVATGSPGIGLLPHQLTARARRVLVRADELLDQLRALADQFDPGHTGAADSLAGFCRETSAMTETALRMVQAFPDSASAQLRLCEGVEAILAAVGDRVAILSAAVTKRNQEATRLEGLTQQLIRLASGKDTDVKPFVDLAEALLADAEQAEPLRFLHLPADQPPRFTAAHSLTVAQVIARVVRSDPDLRARPLEPVLAALVHDVGMLRVPAEILAHPGPLQDEQRHAIEQHARVGAQLVGRLLPSGAWLAEATAGHHERMDGTGYPDGLREVQLAPLTRLLAVCDVYAALCAPRPHRAALEMRTALTDTLLLADQGALDPRHAEKLLSLSFYPVGQVVELADGAAGVVVATPTSRHDLQTPARPVVALLTDTRGHLLPAPHHLDLARCEGRSIVRTLSERERRDILGRRYPDLA
jgi:HD-GYP domain-containing protein (c-di-GMP phosphodiesterase class II)